MLIHIADIVFISLFFLLSSIFLLSHTHTHICGCVCLSFYCINWVVNCLFKSLLHAHFCLFVCLWTVFIHWLLIIFSMTAKNRTLVLKNQMFNSIEKAINHVKTLQSVDCYEMQCELCSQILKQTEAINLSIETFYNWIKKDKT